ncbi:portal protein [Gordonia phage Pleakley]|uniref:Portal protein n=1 Tax=Gordonia phage Pleakley TaxID=2283246 RepID=A0A345M6F2_9CAUD|nr:portal protein [Gordonia phage Pleakley]AXH49760.1 portal protein [Gordonia phage Fury]AXH66073.1 portal protein [Gordonia phage Pleakley]
MKVVKYGAAVKAVRPEGNDVPDPDWFLVHMLKDILAGKSRYNRLKQYVEGDPPKPETPENTADSWKEFEAFRRKSRTNYAGQIIGACVDRTTVQGFRTAAEYDTDGDKIARKLWDDNDMDVKGDKAISDSYTYGTGFLLADPISKKAKNFRPWQAFIIDDAVEDPRAGLCIEHNPTEGRDYAYLFLRDVDEYGVAEGKVTVHIAVRDRDNRNAVRGGIFQREVPTNTYLTQKWTWWKSVPTELDLIPLVNFDNRDKLGEFENDTDVLDRINHMLLQRVVIATMQAFKQRGIKGTFQKYDKDGKLIDYDKMFPADPNALWLLPPDAEIWESGQTSIQDILSAVKDDVRDLASVTRTPMNYFTSDSANQSASGAELQNDSYLLKIRDRKARMRSRWVRFMSLMFQINGDAQRADMSKLAVIWMPSDNVSITDRYSAATQAKSLGLSLRTVMREVLNYAPEDIEVAELEMISETLKNAIRKDSAGETTGANPAQQTPLQQRAASATALATSNGATSRSTGATAGRSGQ